MKKRGVNEAQMSGRARRKVGGPPEAVRLNPVASAHRRIGGHIP